MTEQEVQQKVHRLYQVLRAMWPYIEQDIRRCNRLVTLEQMATMPVAPEYQALLNEKAKIEGELIPLVGQDTLYRWIGRHWERDE